MMIQTRIIGFSQCRQSCVTGVKDMHKDPRNLLVAVSRALGRDLDKRKFEDRLLMQKGCYILNSWGFGDMYRYSLYIRGPYSSELADDYYELRDIGSTTDIPEESISRLSEILSKGVDYTEAFATVLLVRNNNPGRSGAEVRSKALSIKPHLKDEILEACGSLAI